MSLTRKPTTLKEARTIAASGAARIAYNAVDCVKRLQDAVLGLKDADILLTDLANAKRPVEKQRLERRLAEQLVLLRTTMESQHVLLRQSIVGLASEATVRACEMTRNHKHTEYLKAGYYKGFETKQHQKRLWQFVKNPTCPWGEGKHTSTPTTPAGPEEEMAAPEAMARVIKPRKCHPLKSPNTVPEHRAPVNGVQYDPKVLQLIIRRNICPTGTAMEWKASDGANKPLKAAIIYWLERGWVGSKGPVQMKREGEKQTLTADCKAEFKAIRQKIQRDYELIEKKGWSVALRWWGQIGRTALQYAAETSQMSDRLHQSGHDVHHADWQEGLNVVKTATAVAQQTQDANCVTPVSAPTVSKYMRAQDLAEGSSRTTTGTTSSLTQTVVREAAAKSLRAVVCYVSTMLYAGYNPIDSNHPRYLKHKLTMNDTDRLVESVTNCAMLPVDNHLLSSQDATTTYVHLNAQPSKTDVGQRKANARSQAPQDIDEEPVELSAEETERLSATGGARNSK